MLGQEFSWKTKDQLNIYAKHWKAAQPKAVVCIVHGLGEHINRYNHVADYFTANGFSCLGNDRRGHGQSEGPRGHVPKFDNFLMEVKHLLATAKAHYKDLPVFLYGHSMGGNIVLNYLIEKQPNIRAAIVTGSWIRLVSPPPALLVQVANVVKRFAPTVGKSNELNAKHLSRDPDCCTDYENDPLVHARVSLGMGACMLDAAKRIDQFSGELSVPLLAMHGGDDQITDPTGTSELAKRLTSEVTLEIWQGGYHEIHNDLIKDEVIRYMVDWMTQYLQE
jgi:alpha-beta hydrolase superfamily lysophospholipase